MKFQKFGAEWCHTCNVVSNAMKSWDQNIASLVESYDIDRDSELASKYKMRSIPTMIVLDDSGNEVARYAGSKITEEVIRQHLA